MKPLPKISFILPTLGREEGLKKCLESIMSLNYPQEKIEVIIIKDEPRIGVPKRVKEGVEKSTGEYIVYAANDMEFYPDCIINALHESQGKALLTFNTGPVLPDEGNICEHFMIRKSFLPQIGGEIFDTDFNHVGVDNILWTKCKLLNQAIRCESAHVIHHHFSTIGEKDEIYNIAWETESLIRDIKLFIKKMKELGVESEVVKGIKRWLKQYAPD